VGYIIERTVFEKHLASQAVAAGARYMVKTTALNVMKKGGRIAGVRAEHFGEEFDIECRLVVAADGVESRIAASAGIPTLNKLADYHSGFQYEMAGVRAKEDSLHIFFGNKIAPKGYVWIFPKGDGIANVGVGILGSESANPKRPREYLDDFIAKNPKFFAGASPIEINAGGIPVSAGLPTFVGDGIMVVGDAAQQVNPIHGGGIAIALYAGKLAGEVGAKAIAEGDVSRERLFEYERVWRETEGKKLSKLLKLRVMMEKVSDEDFETLSGLFSGDDIAKLTSGDFSHVPKLLMRTPQLLTIAKKLV
jgi:digeranylgeranylglycerophospholipid reductase